MAPTPGNSSLLLSAVLVAENEPESFNTGYGEEADYGSLTPATDINGNTITLFYHNTGSGDLTLGIPSSAPLGEDYFSTLSIGGQVLMPSAKSGGSGAYLYNVGVNTWTWTGAQALDLQAGEEYLFLLQQPVPPPAPVGTQSDIVTRLQAVVPTGWFPVAIANICNATLAGLASAFSFLYALLAYIRQQTRIGSATDGFLDLIAGDFFGDGLLRRPGESDNAYRVRILAGILREKNTRHAVYLVLQQLTGVAPYIFEPQRAADTGAYGGWNCGYGAAGGYGSVLLPMQAFVTAYRPLGTGIANIAGYGISTAGYGVGSQGEYADLSMIDDTITDADIYEAVDSVRPTCATLWVTIAAEPATTILTEDSLPLLTEGGSPLITDSL